MVWRSRPSNICREFSPCSARYWLALWATYWEGWLVSEAVNQLMLHGCLEEQHSRNISVSGHLA